MNLILIFVGVFWSIFIPKQAISGQSAERMFPDRPVEAISTEQKGLLVGTNKTYGQGLAVDRSASPTSNVKQADRKETNQQLPRIAAEDMQTSCLTSPRRPPAPTPRR